MKMDQRVAPRINCLANNCANDITVHKEVRVFCQFASKEKLKYPWQVTDLPVLVVSRQAVLAPALEVADDEIGSLKKISF